MKKFIVVLSIISILFLAGCTVNENSKDNELSGDMDNQQQETIENGTFSNEQLIEMVKKYREARGEYIPEFIIVEDETNNIVTIHLYDVVDDHTATSDWYYIDRMTAIGEDLLGKSIDLNLKNSEILNKSFEERTLPFFNKISEISGDRLRESFNNIRLTKVKDYYELKADLLGDVKIEIEVIEEAMQEIVDKNLEQIEIKTVNGEKVVIYSHKPQEIIKLYENVKSNNDYYRYYVEDWISAEGSEEWLNKEGIPMYVLYNGKYYSNYWVCINKEADGYYLYRRELISSPEMDNIKTVNEKDAISIKLFAEDKIILGVISSHVGPMERILTVEEYYNLSPKDGTSFITEDGLSINVFNMSEGGEGIYDVGLDIINGMVYVTSWYFMQSSYT